jgi:drug/metabolite transporter (DMT)-like permease
VNQVVGKPWVAMYVAAGLIWGSSFLFIEYALTALTPIGVAFWRTSLGALAMLITIVIFRSKIPTSLAVWKKMFIAGMFMSSIPFTLFAFAQTYVTSALASIINAVTPMATVIVMLIAFRSEKLRPHVVVGLLIGLVGVLVVLGVWQGLGQSEPIAIAALFVAVTCYGIGTPYVRKNIAPLGIATEVSVFGQIGTAAITLLPIYLLSGQYLTSTPSLEAIGSIVAIGALGSGVAYLLFYRLINILGSAVAATVTYITPIIAVILGVLILNEELHWYEPVGGLIIIVGAAISQGSILRLFRSKPVGDKLPGTKQDA